MRNIFAAVLLVFTAGASAASAQNIDTFRPSLKGGFNLSKFIGSDADEGPDLKFKPGFTFGGAIEIPLTHTLSVQPEALLVSRGARATSEDDFFGDAKLTYSLTYLEVPVLLKWTRDREAETSPFFYAGMSAALKLRAKVRAEFDADSETDNLDDVKGTDIGILVGGGARVRRFLIEGRLARSLFSFDDEDGVDLKHMSLTVLVGFEFGSR